MKMIADAAQEPAVATPDGAQRRILSYSDNLMMVQFSFAAGAVSAWHSHPHEQIGYVVSGTIDFVIEGQDALHMTAGGSYYVAPNVKHNVVTHTPAVLVEIFSPIREDFLS